MKTIRVSLNHQRDSIRIDLSEGIKMGDIAEIQCKEGTFMVHIVQWDPAENNCTKCALYHARCMDGNICVCKRIISRRRVCFKELGNILEDL